MLVNEEMVARYRKTPDEQIDLRSLPKKWFSDSESMLGEEWFAGDNKSPSAVSPVLAFSRCVPPLHAGRNWYALWHQSGGYSTSANLMIATPLTPNPEVKADLDRIATKFYYAEAGHFNRSQTIVSLIIDYVNELRGYGLNCEASWRLLEEAIYPVDATQYNLDRISIDAPNLSQIMHWGEKAPRYITDPAILLLTGNSD